MPGLVWFILAGIVGLAILAPTLKARMNERFNPAPLAAASTSKVEQGTAGKAVTAQLETTFIDDRVAFNPRVSNKPESAPAYDELRKVVNMPQVVGGMCFKGSCKCVTQQGTDAGLTDRECKAWIQNPPFDNYRQQVTVAVSGSPSGYRQSEPVQTGSAPVQAATVPAPSSYENPRADARPALLLPPGSPVHPAPQTGAAPSIAPPTLLSPYRRS
jgi:zona occludens toxin